MPPDHVLTKSFYLLSDMPGRWTGGKLWIEPGGGRVNDGVTTVIIGSNDYAGAWAVDQRGRGIMPVTPGGETQREMSYRVGVNLVMHALTGNYKDDQVHLPRHHAEAAAMNPTSAVSVAFDPLLPWAVLVGARRGRAGAGAARPGAARAARCGGWLAVVVVLAALANPSLIEEQRKPIADVALVVTDDSDSMAIGERRAAGRRPRSEALKKKLTQQEGLEVARSHPAALAHPARQRAAGRHAPDRDHALGAGRGAAGAAGRRDAADRRPGARRPRRPAARAGRRAGACADRRQEGRARPADRGRAVAALRRRRPRGDRPSSASRIPPAAPRR